LIAADGTLKISDFGVSFMFEGEDDALRKTTGTPAFMAPEICSGAKEQFSGRAVDIWAVGVTLFCLIFGRVPFIAPTVIEIYDKIISDEVTFDFDVEPLLDDLLRRLLDKNPSTRITLPEITKHPWVTKNGTSPILTGHQSVEVSEQDMSSCIRSINKIAVVVNAKKFAKRAFLETRGFSVPDVSAAFALPDNSARELITSVYAGTGLLFNAVPPAHLEGTDQIPKSESLDDVNQANGATHGTAEEKTAVVLNMV